MNNLPLNPMLHKSIIKNYYRVYCSNKEKLIGLCETLKVPVKNIKFNNEFRVWEFITRSQKCKDKINELFYDSNMIYMELIENDED